MPLPCDGFCPGKLARKIMGSRIIFAGSYAKAGGKSSPTAFQFPEVCVELSCGPKAMSENKNRPPIRGHENKVVYLQRGPNTKPFAKARAWCGSKLQTCSIHLQTCPK